MKLLTILFLFPLQIFATGVELGTGGLTPHFVREKKNYCNQWNNTGIIANKSYYIGFSGEKLGFTYMQGNDSICSPIEGIFLTYYFSRSETWDLGITAGGYSFEMDNWEDHAEKTPESIAAPSPVWTRIGNKTVVPVLAVQANLHLIRSGNWSFKLNNLLTPIITNHSISLEYRF